MCTPRLNVNKSGYNHALLHIHTSHAITVVNKTQNSTWSAAILKQCSTAGLQNVTSFRPGEFSLPSMFILEVMADLLNLTVLI